MIKRKFLKICLFMLMLVFCSYFSGAAFAGICDECNNSGGVQTFSGIFIVPPEWRAIKWAPDNLKVINRNATLTVSVINGTYPYSWSVSGTGFSLDPVQTQKKGSSNKLTAEDTACGAAEITVTDNDGIPETMATGYVRCTSGTWGPPHVVCGEGTGILGYCSKINGMFKYLSIPGEGCDCNYACDCNPGDENCIKNPGSLPCPRSRVPGRNEYQPWVCSE